MTLPSGTVGMFLVVLRSELTKRNPYALGIMHVGVRVGL